MLTLAGLEAQAARSTMAEQVDLGDVVAEVVEHFRSAAELAGLTTTVRLEGSIRVSGEREKLRVLVSNLIHNAMQHSAPGGEVRALLRSTQGEADLRIEDDGEGIAPEVLPFVFDRFFRGDVSRSRRTGGTGLGLAISRAIVQEMDGNIRIESDLDHGTRVFVSLPVPRTAVP